MELHLDRRENVYSRIISNKLRSPYNSVIPTSKNIFCQQHAVIIFYFLVPFTDECLPIVAISNSNIPKDHLEGYKIKSDLLEAVNN